MNEPDFSKFEMPKKGIPADDDQKVSTSTDDQPVSPELAAVIAEFNRVSLAQKPVIKPLTPGKPALRKVALSVDEQTVSNELAEIIDQLKTSAAKSEITPAQLTPPEPEEVEIQEPSDQKKPGDIAQGVAARKVIPKSVKEQPISLKLASDISKLNSSIGFSSFKKEERISSPEVQFGKIEPTQKIALKTESNVERTPPKHVSSIGLSLKGKEPKPIEPRDTSDLVTGANVKTKICPKCKTNTASENNLCAKCGYNFIKGRKTLTPKRKIEIRKRCEAIFWVSALLIALFILLSPRAARKAYEKTVRNYISPVFTTYIQPYLTNKRDPEIRANKIDQLPLPVLIPAVAGKEPAEPIFGYIAPEFDSQDQIRQEIRRLLDLKFPPMQAGDIALFTTTDDTSATATFIGVENNQVILNLNGTQTSGAIEKLMPEVRIRIDPAYREKYIREKAAKLFLKAE
jgi:ribosomal protein L40E